MVDGSGIVDRMRPMTTPIRTECDRCETEGMCYPVDGITTVDGDTRRPFYACCQPKGARWLPRDRKTLPGPTEDDLAALLLE
jgi:hypothetical protein